MPNGGWHLPYSEDKLSSFEPPRKFLARYLFGDTMDGRPSDPKKRIMELHVNSGRTPAQELKRVLVASDRGKVHLRTTWMKFRRSVAFVVLSIRPRMCR